MKPYHPTPAMKTVDKASAQLNPAIMAGLGAPKPLAGIIKVVTQLECKTNPLDKPQATNTPGTDVAFQKTFTVNGHNYLFTSACCEDCIKVKHKKMLQAYLIHHGMKPGSLKLWWKVWRATR